MIGLAGCNWRLGPKTNKEYQDWEPDAASICSTRSLGDRGTDVEQKESEFDVVSHPDRSILFNVFKELEGKGDWDVPVLVLVMNEVNVDVAESLPGVEAIANIAEAPCGAFIVSYTKTVVPALGEFERFAIRVNEDLYDYLTPGPPI